MPNWKKLVVSGSAGNLSSLSVDTTVSASIISANQFTGSLFGTASQAVSSSYALTASYALNGGSGGSAGLTTTFTQSLAADPWIFVHNLNTKTPLIQVYDTSFSQISPQYISASDAQTVIIGFGIPTAGYAVGSTGGTLTITGSNVILDQTVAATTWSFNHNLGTQYPIFQVFNTANEVIIPQNIVATTITSSLIYFPTAIAGKAVASVGGYSGSITSSYAVNALSSSYSLSGSYALTASFATTASYLNPITNSYVVLTQVSQSLNFADDTAAAAGGVPLGGLYRNGNFILIRLS